MKNLDTYNKLVITMVSNASKVSATSAGEVMNYAFVTFLRNNLAVNLDNFKTIMHVYALSQCNGFGIADD